MKEKIQYVCLAKSIPEEDRRDGKYYTCSLGYSPQKGLIRVYPLPINAGFGKWDKIELYVEKNKRDYRKESWKVSSNSRHEDFIGFENDIIHRGRVTNSQKSRIENYLQQLISPSISDLNKNRKSIGIIRADSLNAKWVENTRYINTSQSVLFADVEETDYMQIYTKNTKEKISRITFKDEDGTWNLQYNEWGIYRGGEKLGFNKDRFKGLHDGKPKLLLLGNMLQYPTNWMVLTYFSAPKAVNHNLFGMVS